MPWSNQSGGGGPWRPNPGPWGGGGPPAPGGNAEFYAPFEANAKRWYTFCQERVPYVNHAIIHPPVDRDKPPDQGLYRILQSLLILPKNI